MTPAQVDASAPAPRGSLGLYRLALIVLMLLFGLSPFLASTDVDFWWHLRSGQFIWESGLPQIDPFSYTAGDRAWINHEWLTDLIFHTLYQSIGYAGLACVFGVLQALECLVLYRLMREAGAGSALSVVMAILGVVLFAPTWGVRPQILGALFLGIFHLILRRYRRQPLDTARLWLLPLLTMLWVNLHGTFLIGIGLIAIFVVGEAGRRRLFKPAHALPLRPLVFTLLGCIAASAINPQRFRLWLIPFGYLDPSGENPLNYIQEWHSPDFHSYSVLVTFGGSLILLCLVGLARSLPASRSEPPLQRHGIDPTDALLVFAFVTLGLQAAYNLPAYAMIVYPILAGRLAQVFPALAAYGNEAPTPMENRINWLLAAVLLPLFPLLAASRPQAQLGATPRLDSKVTPYPEGAVRYLAGLQSPIRMFNELGWGGYLLHELYPRQKVFIDGRLDLYRGAVFDDSIKLYQVRPGWQAVLDRYRVDTVVIPADALLATALSFQPGWTRSYQDTLAVVYRRALADGDPDRSPAAPAASTGPR